MKTQQDIVNKLIEFSNSPEFDPLRIKREAVIRFASYETLMSIGPVSISEDEWHEIPLEYDAITFHLLEVLNRAYNEAVTGESGMALSRAMQEVEMFLWVLEDYDSIQLMLSNLERAKSINYTQYLISIYSG